MKPVFLLLYMGLIVLGLSSCSSTTPILYPNAHYQSVGQEIAAQDIDYCKQLAKTAGAHEYNNPAASNVARHTIIGAGAGAASGAVGGAITGSPGRGSLIGATSGATWGLFRGFFSTSRSRPSPAFTNFVNRCLQERGYEVTGWQ